MLIQGMGTIQNYLKTMKLEKKWQERKENPFLAKGKETDPQIATLRKQAEDTRRGAAISSIEAKLKSGGELSGQELEYLKENAPDLYRKAVQIQKEREEYRRQLEQCRTKEDVSRLNAGKIQQFCAQAKSVAGSNLSAEQKQGQMELIGMRMAAVQNEHMLFLQTPEYAALPDKDTEQENDNTTDASSKQASRDLQCLLRDIRFANQPAQEPPVREQGPAASAQESESPSGVAAQRRSVSAVEAAPAPETPDAAAAPPGRISIRA